LAQPVNSLFVNFSTVATGSLLVGPAIHLGGSLNVFGARTTSTFTLRGQVGGSVSYKDLAGANDTITVETNAQVGGSLDLNVGEGTNLVQLKQGTVGGNLSVKGMRGADTVEVLESGNLTVAGSATFGLGVGANKLTAKAANRLTIGKDFTYSGFAGADTIDFQANTAGLAVGGNAKLTVGGPFAQHDNTAYFNAVTVGGALTVTGGAGGDDVEFYNGLALGGDFTFSAGDGYNYLDFNFASVGTNTIGGKVAYTGGKNLDVIYMDGTTVAKSAVFDLKDAVGLPTDTTDPLYNHQTLVLGQYMTAGNRIYGNLSVKSGTGVDLVDLARTYVAGGLTIDLGAGSDTVRANDLFVSGRSKFNLGAGNDKVEIELLSVDANGNALDGATSFAGTVTVLGGTGTDTLNLSDDADGNTIVRFGSLVTLDGGADTDTLLMAPDTVFLGGPIPTAF